MSKEASRECTQCFDATLVLLLKTWDLCRASPSYSLTAGKEQGPAHVLDAVRLLLSWLWDGEGMWNELTVDRVKGALLSAKARDTEKLEDHMAEVLAVKISREERAKKRKRL